MRLPQLAARLPRPTHRTLLVLTTAVAVTGAVLLGLGLLHLLVSGMARVALDDSLENRAAPLARAAANGDLGVVESDAYAQVLRPDGTVLARSAASPVRPLLSGDLLKRAAERPVARDALLPGLGQQARVRAVPVPGGDLVVAVASSRDATDLFLSRHVHVTAVLLPLLVVALVAASARLVHEALRPTAWLADEARAAASGKRDQVRTLPGDDEMAVLAGALDQMLQRVRQVEARERTFVADAERALRTPVGVMRTELRHALSLSDPAEMHRSLRLSVAEAERLATLSADLVVLADARSGTLRLTRKELVLTDVAERACRAMRTALGVRATAQGDGTRVMGDRARLEQAVTYLVANSAAAGAGRVDVTVRRDGDRAVLEVSDDGPGFPTEVLPVAFETFTRGNGVHTPRTAGAGLGLAVVAALSRAHGGDATADNRGATGGGRVTVTFPAVGPAPGQDETQLLPVLVAALDEPCADEDAHVDHRDDALTDDRR